MTRPPCAGKHVVVAADDPRHGTYAGAMAHWKAGVPICEPCRLAATRSRKANELAALSGRPKTVVLGEAYDVILSMPRNQLVAATGMPHARIRRYEIGGPTKRVHRATRDRILAASTPAWTPVGVQRRLQALAALGWSLRALGSRSGLDPTSLGQLRRRAVVKHVRLEFAAGVVALYDELVMRTPTPGASATETKNEARSKRWAPPLAWDDIDDPAAKPYGTRDRGRSVLDPVVVERLLAGEQVTSNRAEKEEAMRRWRAMGNSDRSFSAMHGWKQSRYSPGTAA